MKNFTLLILLFISFQKSNAQTLSLSDLIGTFDLPEKTLDGYLKGKEFKIFNQQITADSVEISRIYRHADGSVGSIYFFDIYYIKDTAYNYQIRYITPYLDEFKAFEKLLVKQNYKKTEDANLSYSNVDYKVELAVIKVSSTINTYKVTILNDKLGTVMMDILFQKLLKQ